MRDRTKERQLRIDRIAKGICTDGCGNPAVNTITTCAICSEKRYRQYRQNKLNRKERTRQLHAERISQGLCRCGEPASVGTQSCAICLKKSLKSSKKLYKNRVENGMCRQCGKHPPTGCVLCETCYLKRVARVNLEDPSRWQNLDTLFKNQNGKCPYTGRELRLGHNTSLDHILPKCLGGTSEQSNLQWVCTKINNMKWDMPHDDFLDMLCEVHRHTILHLTGR